MLCIEFAPSDLVGLRFAHSPLVEAVTSAFALTRPSRYWMYAGWRARVRPRLATADVGTFLALVAAPTCFVPDFLTPVPATARPTLDDELRAVAATPLDRVAEEVHAAWAGHPAPDGVARFATDPAGALDGLIRQIRRYFTVAVAPLWPRLRATVEAEIARRGTAAVEHGPGALLRGLHSTLDWTGTAIQLAHAKSREWTLDGHPLTLLPAGFAGPRVHTMTEAPTGRALWYPPRAYGQLWAEPSGAEPGPDDTLSSLLGTSRAAVLTLLGVPHSTGEVAEALALAPATASHHLTVLRDAGLVAGERVGRRLRYRRTGLGEQLRATSTR